MVRSLCFSTILVGLLLSWKVGANPPLDEDNGFKNTLAVQQAMEQARHLLLEPNSKKAVEVLEEQLPRINGNPNFLRLLREAYRTYIKDLWLARQGQQARKYLDRLCIIDPSAAQDPILMGAQPSNEKKVPEGKVPEQKVAINQNVIPGPTRVRAKEEDPFALVHQKQKGGENQQVAKQFLENAEAEFSRRRFAEARVFYERAYQEDPKAIEPCRDRWAYCMLNQVVEQLNQPHLTSNSLTELQKKVHGAMALAPGLDETGKWLLREIDNRHRTQVTGTGPENQPAPVVNVQHLGRNNQGWQVAETTHFRIFHNQSREFVEKVAQVTEQTRQEMYRKWFGHEGIPWQPKCDLFLHETAGDYSRVTGVPATSPGHARIETDAAGQRVVGRRMDMRCDVPGMLETVLPHETTHVVLAGMYGQFAVPRWADEGMAVLTEPTEKVEHHRRNLLHCPKELLFGLQELMQLADYPHPRRVGAFYAQSVFLVEFLTQQRGPLVFTEFMRDGLREGYELALRRHYGWSFSDLEGRWAQYAFGDNGLVAQGK